MRCSLCGEQGFKHPRAVQKHRIEKHGASAEKKPRASRSLRDVETKLLAEATDLFANAETDTAGDARVLQYLNARFGPEAYTVEEAPAEDETPED